MDCTPPTFRAPLRIFAIGFISAIVAWSQSPTALGQYGSAGIDLREHRSAQHSYAVDHNGSTQVSHEQLQQFAPTGRDIQAIKKGRLTERDMQTVANPNYYRESLTNATQGSVPSDRSGSFIERERTTESGSRETAQDLITRIGVNLAFVLALAIGGVLIYKQLQRGTPLSLGENHEQLRVCQTLKLTTGASIYVVEGFGKKFLVAIDSGGIKSVEVLNTSFRQTLDQTEAEEELDLDVEEAITSFARGQRQRESSPRSVRSRRREQQEQARREREEPTSELDAKLINLLLQRTKQAA